MFRNRFPDVCQKIAWHHSSECLANVDPDYGTPNFVFFFLKDALLLYHEYILIEMSYFTELFRLFQSNYLNVMLSAWLVQLLVWHLN